VIFLADESIDRQIVEAVRRIGYEVLSIAEISPGIPDSQVLNRANEAGAVLLTADKDFGELVFRQHLLHSGVVLVRLAGSAPEAKAEILAAVIEARAGELELAFSVVTSKAVRIRRVQT
jgi:predicted nuclease of predicted toxin-antitoxin system